MYELIATVLGCYIFIYYSGKVPELKAKGP